GSGALSVRRCVRAGSSHHRSARGASRFVLTPEAVELAAIALGRSPAARIAEQGGDRIAPRSRWAVVDVTLGRDRRPDPLVDQPDHLDDAIAVVHEGGHAVTDAYDRG